MEALIGRKILTLLMQNIFVGKKSVFIENIKFLVTCITINKNKHPDQEKCIDKIYINFISTNFVSYK